MHDKLFARDARERRLAAMGVPRFLWNPRPTGWRFSSLRFGDVRWGAAEQRNIVGAMVHDARKQLLCFGADDAGLELAHWIGYKISTIPMCHDMQDEFKYAEQYPKILILHNILTKATDERVQRTRDLLVRFRNTCRIVVVDTRDPYGFSVKRLGLKPDGCCCLRYRS